MLNLVGTGCDDCSGGACTMNCSGSVTATGVEWIAASIWAGVFPARAKAEQVVAWRQRDNGSRPEGENSRSEVEGEARQSGSPQGEIAQTDPA